MLSPFKVGGRLEFPDVLASFLADVLDKDQPGFICCETH